VLSGRIKEMAEAFDKGDNATATRIHRELLPAYVGMFRTQGVITAKAALNALGLPAGPVRPPLCDLTPDETATLRDDLAAVGIAL